MEESPGSPGTSNSRILVSHIDEEPGTFEFADIQGLDLLSDEDYQDVEHVLTRVDGGIIRRLAEQDFSSAGYYVQNVVAFRSHGERVTLYNYLLKQGANFKRRMFGFSFDDDHCHIFHDCAFSSGYCKCFWKRNLPVGEETKTKRFKRRRCSEFGRRDWAKSIIYLLLQKRQEKEMWINGRLQRLQNDYHRVSQEELEDIRKILGRNNRQDGPNLRQKRSYRSGSEETVGSWRGEPKSKRSKKDQRRKTKWEIILEKVSQLIEDTAICPISGITTQPQFLSDHWLTNPDNTKKVNGAIEHWTHKINDFTLRDFENMYYKDGAPKNLIFSVSKGYFPEMKDSVEAVDELLKFQFNDDDGEIKRFLTELVNVLDKQPIRKGKEINLKCNVFLIHSAPSAGKNFFIDAILALLLNTGQFGSANKHNQFAFQDAPNRRVILWNEPNYESSVTDFLKTLFEGGDTKVRVKNMPDMHVKRTPIIVLTNNIVPFMNDLAFKDRIIQFKWKPAPILKKHVYKPFPLAFFEILKKYEIEY